MSEEELKLNKRQKVFVEEYLKYWNATKAAINAGYSKKTAGEMGYENLNKPHIAAEIQRRISELKMDADEVLSRLAKQARGIEDDFIKVEAGLPFLDWDKLEAAGKLDLIKKLTYDKDGRPVVEFYDAQSALALLGKHQKLFTDKIALSTPDGPLEQITMTPEEALRYGRMKAQEREQELLDNDSNDN